MTVFYALLFRRFATYVYNRLSNNNSTSNVISSIFNKRYAQIPFNKWYIYIYLYRKHWRSYLAIAELKFTFDKRAERKDFIITSVRWN